MPTRRAWVFIIMGLGLYLLANQTQVGWVYVMSNIVAGLLLVAFIYSLGMLKHIEARRTFYNLSSHSPINSLFTNDPILSNFQDENTIFTSSDFYEDDPVEISIQFKRIRLKPAFLISGQEMCPFAPSEDRTQSFFVPSLFRGRLLELSYQTICNRRGLYTFSAMKLHSKGPFSLFSTRRTLTIPSEILIYPRYHPLKRLRVLENRGFADKQVMRVGAGSEVVGTREYRSGDSLRQIHWRSTARAGKLVVKEFLDSDQLSMAVVLDLSQQGNVGQGKFSTFETALRLAASFGYYATQQKIPFRLVGQSQRWKSPATPLSWWGTLNYLAKVENDGQESLATVLRNLSQLPFVVVLISNPDISIGQELALLQRKGIQALAIFITPDRVSPSSAPAQSSEGLEVKTVSPYNWSAVLDEL